MRLSLVNVTSPRTYTGHERSILQGCVNAGVCHLRSILGMLWGTRTRPGSFPSLLRKEHAMQSPGFALESERYMMDHMNADHADSNLMYVKVYGNLWRATAARLVTLDKEGMD